MPAKSKAQQKFMGMVHGVQTGQIDPDTVSKNVKDVAKDISVSDAEDFASTKHNGLPDKVDSEQLTEDVSEVAQFVLLGMGFVALSGALLSAKLKDMGKASLFDTVNKKLAQTFRWYRDKVEFDIMDLDDKYLDRDERRNKWDTIRKQDLEKKRLAKEKELYDMMKDVIKDKTLVHNIIKYSKSTPNEKRKLTKSIKSQLENHFGTLKDLQSAYDELRKIMTTGTETQRIDKLKKMGYQENIDKMIENELRTYIKELAIKSIEEYGLSADVSNLHLGASSAGVVDSQGNIKGGVGPKLPKPRKDDDEEVEEIAVVKTGCKCGCGCDGKSKTGTSTDLKGVDSEHGIDSSNIQGGPIDSGHQEEPEEIGDTNPMPQTNFQGMGDTETMPGTENNVIAGDDEILGGLVDIPDFEDTMMIKDPESLKKLITFLQNKEVVEGMHDGNTVQLNKLYKSPNGYKFYAEVNGGVKKINLEYKGVKNV